MDIAIDQAVLRKRQLLAYGRGAAAAVAFLLLLLVLRDWLAPSVDRAGIRTAVVERGEVSTEVAAAGTVVPLDERVLISPVNSSISAVYLPLGSQVRQGDAILKVDSTQIELVVARLRDELRLKDLEIEALAQQQARELRTLRNQQELARIDLQNQQVILERFTKLQATNVVSEFDYDTAALNVRKTELQLTQLARQIDDTAAANHTAMQQREVERHLLEQQLAEQERLLHDTTLRASTDGIVTVLQSEIGQNVTAGSELARVSNLSSYRVDATLSDFYLHQIGVDMPVNIDLGTNTLTGKLSRILPAIDNGTIRLQIELDEPGNPQLKSNLRVEAGIVTQSRAEGLRVSNGIVFNGAGQQQVFVVEDGEAAKRPVTVGLTNSSYVEIVSGLAEGEEIIVSDMTEYMHLDSIGIDN